VCRLSRVPGAANPLDNSAVHPESYHVVEAMAKKADSTVPELIGNANLRKGLKASEFVDRDHRAVHY
jgi:uncharacterized protein